MSTNERTFNWNSGPGFPHLAEDAIDRAHQLHAIADALSSEVPVIFLEGEPLDGATWALAQFCNLKPDQTFSLFITPASKLSYSIDYLRIVLAEQFSHCINGVGISGDSITLAAYRDLLTKVVRRFKQTVVYFVIDGLHQIPTEDSAVVAQIFSDLLPTGFKNCRFIITGKESALKAHLHKSVASRYFQLHRFSIGETKQYLAQYVQNERDCERIYSLCRNGSPGLIAGVRRLLQAGTDIEELLQESPEKHLKFVNREFDVVAGLNDSQQLALAILTFSRIPQTKQDLSEMVGLSILDLEKMIDLCSFLKSEDGQRVDFVSETHRRVAVKLFDGKRNAAHDLQLKRLQQHPNSDVALQFIPVYLETLKRGEALFDLLSKPDHYGNLLERKQSFSELNAQAELAIRSAFEMQKTNEAFRFSLQRSVFATASCASADVDRVKALVALGKTDAALALANTERTKEDQLALLATYARLYTQTRGTPEQLILDRIAQLIQDADFKSMGDRAMRIAADVLIFDVDAAIGIIDDAVKGEAAATRDEALVKFSFAASLDRSARNVKGHEKLHSKISDESLQRIAQSFDQLAREMDSDSMRLLIAKMPPAHQIHFIRTFVSIKRDDEDVLDLVDQGLDTIVSEPAYVPRARDLAELCAPLTAKFTDVERVKRLISRVDSQIGLVSRSAHSRDLTLLQVRLAAGEYQFDRAAALERITSTYYATMDVKTPEVRMECLAVMLGMLAKIDQDGDLESKEGLRQVIKEDLEEVVNVVLAGTGDHLAAVLPVLKVLAEDDCAAAVALAERLNMKSRRDEAYEHIARISLRAKYSASQLSTLDLCISRISNRSHRSKAVVSLLGALETNPDRAAWVRNLDHMRAHCTRGFDLSAWDCWMFKQSTAAGIPYESAKFIARTEEAIARKASFIEEAKLNFCAAEAVAGVDPEQADKLYSRGLEVSSAHSLASSRRAKLFEYCLSLVGRSLASLAKAGVFSDADLERMLALVDKLPGIVYKVSVLSEFAERLWCANRADLLQRVVASALRPQLEYATAADSSVGRAALVLAFPALCATHQASAVELLSSLDADEADATLAEALVMRLTHLPSRDPGAGAKSDYGRVSVEDVVDAIGLISHMKADSTIYNGIHLVADAITDSKNKTRFIGNQKADWANKLFAIVASKLPDGENISHHGYTVVCRAKIGTIVDKDWSFWSALIDDIASIPNTADRAFIFTHVSIALPKRYATHKAALLERARAEIQSIPSPLDRLSHMQTYAQEVFAADAAGSVREMMKAAMTLSLTIDEHSKVAEHRRELIDLADQVDPSFADELVEMIDDDPARAALKDEAFEACGLVKTRRKIANATGAADLSNIDVDQLPNAAWRNLGALLAGRLEPKPTDVMLQFIKRISRETLDKSYPVLAWHLANLERKYLLPHDVRAHLVPHCESVLLAAELTESLLRRVSGIQPDSDEQVRSSGVLVPRMSRDVALEFLLKWLTENAKKDIVLCDPFFSAKDIEFLRLCLRASPAAKIRILTSKRKLDQEGELGPDAFIAAWRVLSDQDPPEVEIIAASTDGGDSPIHDRWLIGDETGLKLGASFHTFGAKLSQISTMDSAEAADVVQHLTPYLERKRAVGVNALRYVSFTL